MHEDNQPQEWKELGRTPGAEVHPWAFLAGPFAAPLVQSQGCPTMRPHPGAHFKQEFPSFMGNELNVPQRRKSAM